MFKLLLTYSGQSELKANERSEKAVVIIKINILKLISVQKATFSWTTS